MGVITNGKDTFLEVFGPTIQGEGMVIGKKTMFVRTYGCDYGCVCVTQLTHGTVAKKVMYDAQQTRII